MASQNDQFMMLNLSRVKLLIHKKINVSVNRQKKKHSFSFDFVSISEFFKGIDDYYVKFKLYIRTTFPNDQVMVLYLP